MSEKRYNLDDVLDVDLKKFLSTKPKNSQKKFMFLIFEVSNFFQIDQQDPNFSDQFLNLSEQKILEFAFSRSEKRGVKSIYSSRDSQNVSKSTVQNYLCILKSLLTFFAKQKQIRHYDNPVSTNLLKLFNTEKNIKRPTQFLESKEVNSILHFQFAPNLKGQMRKASIFTIFGGGLRRSELLNLKVGDVTVNRDNLAVLYLVDTKNKGDITQVLPEWSSKVLLEYIELLKKDLRENQEIKDQKDILNSKLFPISERTFSRFFKRLCKGVGINKAVSSHSARKSAIIRLLDMGFSFRQVKAFSRHSDVKTVEVYDRDREDISHEVIKSLNFDV